MATTVDLVVSEFVVLSIVCALLLRYYKSSTVTFDVTTTVYFSWVLGLAGVLFLPYDISVAIVEGTTSPILEVVWRVVYWITFMLAWVILPIQMEYHSSGHFTFMERLKDSLYKNAIAGVVALVMGLIYIIYMVVSGRSSVSDVIGFLMALSNTYGVLLIIVLMGSGLAAMPKRLWQLADIDEELQRLYISACPVEAAFQDARYELEDCELEIKNASEVIEKSNSSALTSDLRGYIDQLKTAVVNFDFNSRSSTRKMFNTKTTPPSKDLYTKKKDIVDLRARLIKAQVRVRACERRWHTLLFECKQYEEIIDGRAWIEHGPATWCNLPTDANFSPTPQMSCWQRFLLPIQHRFFRFGQILNFIWMNWLHKWLYRFAALCCAVASVFILWGELVMATNLRSPMGVMMGAYESDGVKDEHRSSLIQLMSLLYLSYMSFCTYWTLFRLNLGWQYTLQGPQLSPHTSLIFNGQYFSRLQFAMGYNFLLILNVPSTSRTAFNELMSNMQLIPVFGTSFTIYVPIVMILVSIATVFNTFPRLLRYIGLDIEDSDSCSLCRKHVWTPAETEQLNTGRNLVASELRQLSSQVLRSRQVGQKSHATQAKDSSVSMTTISAPTAPIEPTIRPLSSFGRTKLEEPVQSHIDSPSDHHHDQEFNFGNYLNDDYEEDDEHEISFNNQIHNHSHNRGHGSYGKLQDTEHERLNNMKFGSSSAKSDDMNNKSEPKQSSWTLFSGLSKSKSWIPVSADGEDTRETVMGTLKKDQKGQRIEETRATNPMLTKSSISLAVKEGQQNLDPITHTQNAFGTNKFHASPAKQTSNSTPATSHSTPANHSNDHKGQSSTAKRRNFSGFDDVEDPYSGRYNNL